MDFSSKNIFPHYSPLSLSLSSFDILVSTDLFCSLHAVDRSFDGRRMSIVSSIETNLFLSFLVSDRSGYDCVFVDSCRSLDRSTSTSETSFLTLRTNARLCLHQSASLDLSERSVRGFFSDSVVSVARWNVFVFVNTINACFYLLQHFVVPAENCSPLPWCSLSCSSRFFLSSISCSSLLQTARMLFEMTLKKFDATELTDAAPFLGPFSFTLFMLVVVFICLSMFLSISNTNKSSLWSGRCSVACHSSSFLGLTKITDEERREERDRRMRGQYLGRIEHFAQKIDELLHALNRVSLFSRLELELIPTFSCIGLKSTSTTTAKRFLIDVQRINVS